MREEGVYLIKRVDSLPPRGNANYLYELKSDIPLTTRYRWKGGEYEALPIGSSSSSGYSFINSSDGLPNTDEDTTAYRTKPIGINEQNPVELIDVVGTQAEGQGGIKLDYTYDSGLITRVQLAGRSILNELGVPVDTIEGLFLDSFSPPSGSYPNFRSYFAGGDLSGVSPLLGDFCSIMGVSNLTSSKGVGINIYPIAGAGEFFTGNIRAFVSGGSQGSHSVAHRGGIAGEDQEHTASSIAANGTESSSINLTPHYIRFKNLMKMSDYGSGTFIESYTHTDTLAKTGTAETTIGEATFGLAVDADGNVMEVPLYGGTSPIQQVKVSLNSAQITTLGTNPIVAVPAQGVGTFIEAVSAVLNYDFNSVQYDNGNPIVISTDSFSGDANTCMVNLTNSFGIGINSPSDLFFKGQLISGNVAENEDLVISTSSDFTTGDGTVDIYIFYRIVNL